MRVRGLRRLFWYGAVALSLAACASLPRNPVPLGLESDATVVGMGENIRFWGDVPPPDVDAMAKEKWAQVRASHRQLPRENGRPVVSFLAISGGGADGAFGAGVLAACDGTRQSSGIRPGGE